MLDGSLTAQVQAILRHDGPMDIFVIGLARWQTPDTVTEYHYLANNLRDLAARVGCPCFTLPSDDFVIVCENHGEAVRNGIGVLEATFAEAHELAERIDLPLEHFDLPADWESLRQRLRRTAIQQLRSSAIPPQPLTRTDPAEDVANRHHGNLSGVARSGNAPASSPKRSSPTASQHDVGGPLTPRSLAEIMDRLDGVNFANFISRQACYRHEGKWEPIYVEHFSNMELLRQRLFPKTTYDPDEPLFFELCRHLDRLMLFTLLIERPARSKPIGINLTAGIVGTREFDQFVRAMTASERANTVIEIHWMDALRSLNSGNTFLAQLAVRGFKIAIDKVSIDMLPVVAAANFSFDYLKLSFDIDKLSCLAQQTHAKSFTALDRSKIIMINCDDPKSLKIGNSLGVSGYQGWFISKSAKNARPSRPEVSGQWTQTLKKTNTKVTAG